MEDILVRNGVVFLISNPQRSVYLFWVFSIFEMLDFPPVYKLIDAHTVWHAGTILPWYLFWEGVRLDCIFEENHNIWMRKLV